MPPKGRPAKGGRPSTDEEVPRPAPVDEDVEFPRGGASALTALERRQVELEAKAEVDRELAGGAPAKKAKLDDDEVRVLH